MVPTPSFAALPLLLLLVVASSSSPLNNAFAAPTPEAGAGTPTPKDGAGTPMRRGIYGFFWAKPTSKPTVPPENANDMIDAILKDAEKELEAHNIVKLSDAKFFGFSKEIVWVTVDGEAKVFDGSLEGLQSLYRTGDATMETSPDGLTLTIDGGAGLKNMIANYRCDVKFMSLFVNVKATVKISVVEIKIKIMTNFATGKKSLLYFDISKVGKIDVSFDGLGPLDWIINPLGGWVVNLVKAQIANVIEGPLRGLIAKKVQEVDLPIG